ncbi:MAG: hypothetical protein LBE24_10090 [Methylobacillus sp.]|nr:hypothetical protein [Methylobacillus sp.]
MNKYLLLPATLAILICVAASPVSAQEKKSSAQSTASAKTEKSKAVIISCSYARKGRTANDLIKSSGHSLYKVEAGHFFEWYEDHWEGTDGAEITEDRISVQYEDLIEGFVTIEINRKTGEYRAENDWSNFPFEGSCEPAKDPELAPKQDIAPKPKNKF